MKATTQTLTFTLALALLASCSTSQTAGRLEYDDMYYTATDRQMTLEVTRERKEAYLKALAEQEKAQAERSNIYKGQDPAAARQLNPDAADDYYAEEEYESEAYY